MPACLSYIVEGNRIRLPDNPGGVQFAFPIGDVVEMEGTIVICLVVPEGSRCTENVYSIDKEGNLRWRIRPQGIASRKGPYLGLNLAASGLQLYKMDGRFYDLDLANGMVLEAEPRNADDDEACRCFRELRPAPTKFL